MLHGYELEIIETVIAIVALLLLRQLIARIISWRVIKADFNFARKVLIGKVLNFLLFFFLFVFLAGIWGVKRTQIFTYLASVLTVIGIGFLAQWSLLSNITSGLILFFYHPASLGDYVSIVIDNDNSIDGRIEDMTFFFIHIRDRHNHVFTISNTEVIQKRIRILQGEDIDFELPDENSLEL